MSIFGLFVWWSIVDGGLERLGRLYKVKGSGRLFGPGRATIGSDELTQSLLNDLGLEVLIVVFIATGWLVLHDQSVHFAPILLTHSIHVARFQRRSLLVGKSFILAIFD